MIQFYAPDILINPVLPESDSQHCVRVLRMGVGDRVEVIDGRGHRYTCSLVDAHPKRAMVEVVDVVDMPLPWTQTITVAVAPTKHLDRMEWLVEKLVEVGVNRIIPLRCRHSERKEIKTERLEKIAISAMKQSLKAVLPEILPMTPISSVLGGGESSFRPIESQKFIAYCDDSVERRLLTSLYEPQRDVIILIGPEGDFSEEEVRLAFDHGYQAVSLGENRLRTETAALYACSAFHILDEVKLC